MQPKLEASPLILLYIAAQLHAKFAQPSTTIQWELGFRSLT